MVSTETYSATFLKAVRQGRCEGGTEGEGTGLDSGRCLLHRVLCLVASLAAFGCMSAQVAGADPPDFILQMPEGQTSPGGGAAELRSPRGIGGDPDSGHVYIADAFNARISEYTAWGLFVKSWGWGVADGSSELQTCGPPQPEEDPEPSLCRPGSPGS